MRGELSILLETWNDKEHKVDMFMHVARSADDDDIAEMIMDQVAKQIDETPDVVCGHATLVIPEMDVQYEFSYMMGGNGDWESQTMH